MSTIPGALHHIGAPWHTVVSRLGLELSADRAKKLVATFRAMPAELASDMDNHDITLASRMEWLRLHRGRQHAADQIWAAIKDRGHPELLTRTCTEAAQHPGADAHDLIGLAQAAHDTANQARAAAHVEAAADQPAPTVPADVVDTVRAAMSGCPSRWSRQYWPVSRCGWPPPTCLMWRRAWGSGHDRRAAARTPPTPVGVGGAGGRM